MLSIGKTFNYLTFYSQIWYVLRQCSAQV